MSADINIPDHWQLATINDIQANEKRATITGPFGSSIGKRFFVSEGIPVIRGNNLSYKVGTFDDSGFVYITREKANELKGYIAKPGDLIFTAAGTIGQVALIPFAARFEEYIISNKQMRVRLDLEKVDTFYAYYWFSCPMMNAYIKRQDTGSTIPLINLSVLRALPIPLPPLQEQRTIATILKSLDDKIGINHQINQTLEQMAQAIFKSWFVDFEPVKAKIAALEAGGSKEDALLAAMQAISGKGEAELTRLQAEQPEQYAELRATAELFPSAMQDSELGEIPEGWLTALSGDVIDVRDGTHDSPKRTDHGYPLVTSRHITSGTLRLDDAYLISKSDFEKVNQRSKVDNGDILLTMIGTVGIPYVVNDQNVNFAIKNVGLFKTSKSKELSGFFYLLLKSDGMKAYLESRMAGTTQKYLSLKTLREIDFVLPSSQILAHFSQCIAPFFAMIQVNTEQTKTLCAIRNSLLPKLLSGELTVSDARSLPAEVEEAADV